MSVSLVCLVFVSLLDEIFKNWSLVIEESVEYSLGFIPTLEAMLCYDSFQFIKHETNRDDYYLVFHFHLKCIRLFH